MKSIEEKWQNYEMPDKKMIDEIEREATKFLATTKEVAGKQPFCNKDPQNYDQEFSKYKLEIDRLSEQNNSLNRAVNNYAKIKNCLQSISADVEKINKTISKYEPIAEATDQVTELKTSLFKLKLIQSQLEDFEKNQLSKFEELKNQLGESLRLLDTLKKPTHEFTPIKRESLAEKITQYPDPECPIKYGHKASKYPIVEKCNKCGARRKSTPVDIG
jgi:DNA repair exonuclease SbcCD ATPase subunit